MITQEKISSLKKGIKLFFSDTLVPQEHRLELSSGTTQEIEPLSEYLKYRPGSFVPKEPWREPTKTEASFLFANTSDLNSNAWDLGSSIGAFRLSDDAVSPLEDLLEQIGTRSAETPQDYKSAIDHPSWKSALSEILKILPPYCLPDGKLSGLDLQETEPGLKTVTPKVISLRVTNPGLRTITKDDSINLSKSFHIGMHLDSWDRAPLRQRHKSRNRICINLGREDRYFLFINLSLMDMFRALDYSDEDVYKHYRGLNVGVEFMKRYPLYPVVRLRLLPGEAYIAPTDNIIHDASSIGKRYPDVTLAFIGHFGLPLQAEG
jgi:hypothetical protein